MITAVDTNILIDILEPDPEYGPASRDYLKMCRREGVILGCGVVWAEVATYGRVPIDELMAALDAVGLEFSAIDRTAAIDAARSWRAYRKTVAKRDRIVAAFLIGAHAKTQCDRLLTRDRGFYREYFNGLEIVDPSV